MHPRMLILVATCTVAACATAPGLSANCEAGKRCEVSGVLAIEGPGQASVDNEGLCYALALPDSFFKGQAGLSGRAVTVIGGAFSQPDTDVGTVWYSYEVDGMKVRANLCDMALSVDEIRSLSGDSLWQKK